MQSLLELSLELESIKNTFREQGNTLSTEISNVDKELSDLYHYIETSNLNACDGYKVYKKLRDCLQSRRECKNKMLFINSILDSTVKDCNPSLYSKQIKSQVYHPRIEQDLFPEEQTRLVASFSNNVCHFSNVTEAYQFIARRHNWGKSVDENKVKVKILKAAKLHNSYDGIVWSKYES